ncbi:zinc-dependent alcohol dehydrogenase family protein [Paraburkholderia unamae]|uniref:NADPH:quinone reductase-like Zn-dependent oxidoreductase n=1 Tax=Paraburkholderia unamae TaxID=219649 RepID=A0ABX5KYP9_9BURK|nr:zinc-dependent alcohol dehydrogenase family protein [Paraburkholderia unamae]PVX86637.1 NADPH:quinone reductase-like Zn-dependent oxidoreductase [Paraburkholderia unamae]CAG9273686.1 Zinc-binding dehydrogenase family protein [Paraburkholderia unamae]
MSKVVRFHQIGGPEVLQFDDVEVAAPQAGEVQIRVKALGINRAEVMYRTGQYVIDPVFPAKLGYEASGEVIAVGAGANAFSVGDAVSVIPAFSFAEYGMYGEVVNAPVHAVARNPAGVTHEEAAATWMMFVTAYGALINYGKLKSGDTVVIGAATSSVGLAAIQVANMVGARTIALTRSKEKERTLREVGADHVLLGDDPNLTDAILRATDSSGARVVFDPVGGPNARNIIRAMSHDGIYYQYGALDSRDIPVPVMEILTKHIVIQGYELFEITTDPDKLEQAKAFISEGLASKALRPVIDRVFRFDDIAEAHRYMEAGNQIGKIVVAL